MNRSFCIPIPILSRFFRVFLLLSILTFTVPPSARARDAKGPSIGDRPNILLITVDSLRPDHMGCYGYEKPTTPRIDRLSKESTLFAHAVAQGGWTSPAMVSIFTGMYPSVHGVEGRHDRFPCAAKAPLKAWAQEGYRIPGYGSINDENNYSGLGFQPDPEYGYTLDQFTAWIRKHRSQPFFCWYHINKTPHLPYRPDETHRTLFPPPGESRYGPAQRERLKVVESKVIIPRGTLPLQPEDRPAIEALYDGEVRMADDTVGRIYDFLRSEGLLDSTVIILTADHGEELLDHGFIGHASTNWAGTLYEEIVHVPLIIRYPGRFPAGTVVDEVVETLDILPTLQEMFEIPSPTPFQGRSMLPLLQGDAAGWLGIAFSENTPCGYQCKRIPEKTSHRIHAVRSGPWKLVASFSPEKTRFELYNLSSDPAEEVNQIRNRPEIAARLKDLLLVQAYKNRLLHKQIRQDCTDECP